MSKYLFILSGYLYSWSYLRPYLQPYLRSHPLCSISRAFFSSFAQVLLAMTLVWLLTACANQPQLSSFQDPNKEISLSATSDDRQKERIIRNQIIALGDKTPLRAQVRVYNNQAVLIGEVLNQGTKEKLEVIAVRQAKVKKVFNLLTVVNPLSEYKGFSDLLLKTRVSFALAGVKELDTTRIDALIDRQRILLLGAVTVEEANILVERLRRVTGVEEIIVVFDYI